MTKTGLMHAVTGVVSSMQKHSPEILLGIGIAGMVTTAVLAAKATPKATKLVEEEIERQNDILVAEADESDDVEVELVEKLPFKETFKVSWKAYIPAVVIGTISIACLIGSNSMHSKQKAVLATAYKLSEAALLEYKGKVIETIGEEKEKVIREKIIQEKIDKDPVSSKQVIITKAGDTLCYDAISGRYFKSDLNKIESAVNELNRRMLSDMYVSLNDFYDELGLGMTDLGDGLGWNLHREGFIEPDYSSHVTDEGSPALVISYRVAPRYDFSKLM